MDVEMVVLRLLHIFLGVFWAGGVFYLAFFVLPAINALGPDGSKFMQQLTKTKKMPMLMLSAGGLVFLAGLRMMDKVSGHFMWSWISSPFGTGITIGSLAALAALIIGGVVNRPKAEKMAKIAADVASAGGTPTAGQLQELGKLKAGLEKGVKVMAWHLVVAVVCMATARYWYW